MLTKEDWRQEMKVDNSSSAAVTRAVSTLRAILIEIGWDPKRDDQTAGFVVEFDPPYIPVAYAYAAISPKLEMFVFYLNFGVAAAAERRQETARFLSLANWSLMSGNFEMDWDDGQVRFRSSICFQGTDLSGTLIRNAIRFAMNAVERYAEGVIDVMARGKCAEEAFQKIDSAEDLANDLSDEATDEEAE